jgi:hypothetical protein
MPARFITANHVIMLPGITIARIITGRVIQPTGTSAVGNKKAHLTIKMGFFMLCFDDLSFAA